VTLGRGPRAGAGCPWTGQEARGPSGWPRGRGVFAGPGHQRAPAASQQPTTTARSPPARDGALFVAAGPVLKASSCTAHSCGDRPLVVPTKNESPRRPTGHSPFGPSEETARCSRSSPPHACHRPRDAAAVTRRRTRLRRAACGAWSRSTRPRLSSSLNPRPGPRHLARPPPSRKFFARPTFSVPGGWTPPHRPAAGRTLNPRRTPALGPGGGGAELHDTLAPGEGVNRPVFQHAPPIFWTEVARDRGGRWTPPPPAAGCAPRAGWVTA